ncbi:MAG: pyridoxine 5'-phosphate synthase [Verrucomicrobiota bacterium]
MAHSRQLFGFGCPATRIQLAPRISEISFLAEINQENPNNHDKGSEAPPPRWLYHWKLGVNIGHVATLREAPVTTAARQESQTRLKQHESVRPPAPPAQARTVHLREDRRHIQDRDVVTLRRTVRRG